MGNAGTDFGKFSGVSKEVYNLLQLLLFLVRTGHIRKGDLFAVRHPKHSPRFSEVGHGIAAVHPAHEYRPQHQQHRANNQQRKNEIIGREALVRGHIIAQQHTLLGLLPNQVPVFPEKQVPVRKVRL